MSNKTPEKLIASRYRILKELGKGAMGIVYLVEDILREDRLEALKAIKREIVNPSTLKNFKKEFEVMTRLKHPNLVRVYDFGLDKTEDTYFITMEYVHGIPPKDLSKQQRSRYIGTTKKTLDIVVALCRTLEFIHSRHILHRDIKPGNIMLVRNSIKVMDLGLADLGHSDKSQSKGTLLYMAPEVLQERTDHRVDIFASGMTFYELITGERFYGASQSTAIINILSDKRHFADYRNTMLRKIENPNIRKVIAKMTEYEVEDRYRHSSEVLLAINRILRRNYPLETEETREAYVLGAGFVGRNDELSKLKSWCSRTVSNRMLMVRGRAGIGKSRLYREFKKHCQLENILFLEANCSQMIPKTYAPFLDILNEVLLNASGRLIEVYGPELKKILPCHDKLKKVKVNPTQDPKTERGILIENITSFLIEYGKEQRTKIVLYLNDLHWSDEGSMEVLRELMYKLSLAENQSTALHVYASAREEEIGSIEVALEKLRERKRLEEVVLAPFGTRDVDNYVNAIFGEDYVDTSLRNAVPEIGNKVGGNPFFLQELIKSLVQNELVKRRTLKWELTTSIEKTEVPGNLKEILRRRLDRLSLTSGQKKTLQIFALLNKGISIDAFIPIVSQLRKADSNVEALFSNMERKELLTSEWIEGKTEYSFSHSLIREVVENEVDNKKDFHRLIAERLESICEDSLEEHVEELAYHYSRTEQKEKALFYLEQAGNKAKTSYANRKAIDYYDQLLLRLEGAEKRIEILLKQGNIYELIGEWDNAEALYGESQKLALSAGTNSLVAKSKSSMGRLLRKKGSYKEALQSLKEAQLISRKLKDKKGIGTVTQEIGIIYYMQGDYSKAMRYQKKALNIAKESKDKKSISSAAGNMGLVYYRRGDYSEAIECFERLLRIGEELKDKQSVSRATGNIGIVHMERGDYAKAMECYEKYLKMSEELGDKLWISTAVGNMGVIYLRKEDYSRALECFEKMLRISEELGNPRSISSAICNMGAIYMEQGDYSKAMACYKKDLKISEKLGSKQGICIAVGNIGAVHTEQGSYSRAMACYERALKIANELGDKQNISIMATNIGNISKKLKKYTKADKHYDRAIRLGRELKLKYYLPEYIYEKADLYFLLRKLDEATTLNEEADNLAEEMKRQDMLFRIRVLSMKIEFAKGNKNTAVGELEKLLSQTQEGKEMAVLNYELYTMTDGETYGRSALELYQELYKKTPGVEYRNKTKELKSVFPLPGKVATSERTSPQVACLHQQFRDKLKKLRDTREKPKKDAIDVKTQELEKIVSAIVETKEEGEYFQHFSEFLNIVLMLNSNLILSELFKKIVDLSIRFIDADRGFLMLYNDEGELLTEVAVNSKGKNLLAKHLGVGPLRPKPELQMPQTVLDRVIKNGKPLFVPNIAEVEGLAEAQSVVDMKLKSVMCIPLGRRLWKTCSEERRGRHLLTRGERLGILYLDSQQLTERNRFTGKNLHLLQALADQASVAILNAMLYEKANIDPLTKLYLRPYFENSLKAEIAFNKKHTAPFCVLVMDIDFFKNINDSYGHQTGDSVLQTMGQIFKKTLRTSDICARYGGDEFAVIVPNTDLSHGKLIAGKVLRAVAAHTFSCGQVTLSIGVSVYPGFSKSSQELLKQADEALYTAKRDGHNCYRVWQKSHSLPGQSHITDILIGDPIRDYRNVEMLLRCIKVATSNLDLPKLLDRIVDTILGMTGTERCILMMTNKKHELKVNVARNNKGESLGKTPFYSKSISAAVLETGNPVCLRDICEGTATESQRELSLRSAMCVPLYVKDNRFGVIYVDSRQTMRQFSEAELAFFAALASHLALVIENTRLHEKAIRIGKIKEKTLEKMVNQRTSELNKTKSQLETVLNTAPIHIASIDLSGRYSSWNRMSEKMFGYKADEVTGKLTPRKFQRNHEEAGIITGIVMKQGTYDGEVLLVRRDGSEFPAQLLTTKTVDSSGTHIGFTELAIDITERKRSEETLTQTKIQLEKWNLHLEEKVRERTQSLQEAQEQLLRSERLATIGQLAASIGHEFRNPLGVLQNSVYFLNLKLGDTEGKVRKHLTTMKKELLRSNKIISDLLDFSRRKEPSYAPTDIKGVIEEALSRIALPESVEVIKNLGNELTVDGDGEQLQSVFLNLFVNGIQAMPEGGVLMVKISQKNGFASVKVFDTGIGIPKENAKKIFEPLFTTKTKGIGLGLALTRKIVESHGGSIQVKSRPNAGSVFVVTLPIKAKSWQKSGGHTCTLKNKEEA